MNILIKIFKVIAAIVGFALMTVGCIAAFVLLFVCAIPIFIICLVLFAGVCLMSLNT